MHLHFDFSSPIPACPSDSIESKITHPSTSFIFALTSLACLIFASTIAIKYNFVMVFNKKIRTENISNNLWIIYYSALCLRSIFETLRYSLYNNDSRKDLSGSYEVLESIFFLGTLLLHGIAVFCLCLSLNHQRKFRTVHAVGNGGKPNPQNNKGGASATKDDQESNGAGDQRPEFVLRPNEKDPLIAKYSWVKKNCSGMELIFIILLIIYFTFLYLEVSNPEEKKFEVMFICAFAVQRAPVFVLVILIIYAGLGPPVDNVGNGNANEKLLNSETEPAPPNSADSAFGPSRRSKIYLFIATILNVAGDLPLPIWSKILPGGCVFYIGNWADFINSIYFFSLVFFFLFVRSEYLRNLEECIWNTVSQIQDTFDFRRF